MHGHGTYKFTSGNIYTGSWDHGNMHGKGTMEYADGSIYEGQWKQNLMHGDGIYIDRDRVTWTGIFVEGQYDSKIQKKLLNEKILKDKIAAFETASRVFFEQFAEMFAKSDKKTFKDNLLPFFGTQESCSDYVQLDAFPKYEERPPDKWNEALKNVFEDAHVSFRALSQRDDSKILQPE